METALPKILQRLQQDMRLSSASCDAIAKVLKVEALTASVDAQTYHYNQLWSALESFYANTPGSADFCKVLEKYKAASSIFIPLPLAASSADHTPDLQVRTYG